MLAAPATVGGAGSAFGASAGGGVGGTSATGGGILPVGSAVLTTMVSCLPGTSSMFWAFTNARGELLVDSADVLGGSVRPLTTGSGVEADLGPCATGSDTGASGTEGLISGSAGTFEPSRPEIVSFKK